MVLKKKGPRAAAKRDWRAEPEDTPVARVDSVRPGAIPPRPLSEPPGKPISGVRQKGDAPNAVTVDEVVADLRKDSRRED